MITLMLYLSKSHKHTEPSAAHEAIDIDEEPNDNVASGWNTIAPTLSL